MQPTLNKKALYLILLPGFFLANAVNAQVCPVCVVAIGAGLGFSRWIGIDDIVSSIWIGAFLMATVLWTLMWMQKKKWSFSYDAIVIFLAYYLLTFIPLYYTGIVGHPLNKIWGIDKIIFGTIFGTAAFMLGHWFNLYLKKRNSGKAFFPYQKVVVPVLTLVITSLIFYLLITLKWI
jgi:hypothetical protein